MSTGSLGYLEVTDDIVSALESNVKSLLLTNRGERVMHVDFGCNLREFLFEQNSDQLRGAITQRVKGQLSQWMPFLTLAGLQVIFSEDDPTIQDPGFKLQLQLSYGNIPISLFLLYPVT